MKYWIIFFTVFIYYFFTSNNLSIRYAIHSNESKKQSEQKEEKFAENDFLNSLFKTNIHELTLKNQLQKKVVYSDDKIQLLVHNIKPKGMKNTQSFVFNDQMLCIEKGRGKIVIDTIKSYFHSGDVIIIPAGKAHRIENFSKHNELKFFSVCSPPIYDENISIPELHN